MNKERIEQLAATIEEATVGKAVSRFRDITADDDRRPIAMPTEFNMSNFLAVAQYNECRCETVGCIAGYSLGLFGEGEKLPLYEIDEGMTHKVVARLLDKVSEQLKIDSGLAHVLCTPNRIEDYGMYDEVTPEDAAEAVRNLLKFDEEPHLVDGLDDEELEYELWGHFIDRHEDVFEEDEDD